MKNEAKGDQIGRVLKIYSKLSDGYVVNKAEEAELYGVNERSIQRDIDHIRNFLDEEAERTGIVNTIVYDRIEKGYIYRYNEKMRKIHPSEQGALEYNYTRRKRSR